MRHALVFALILGGCAGRDRAAPSPRTTTPAGPDAILVRMPREGGVARAYRWSSDSVLWLANASSPRIDRVLAFDDEQGALAYVDSKGVPGRLDLRVRSATPAAGSALTALASTDGWAIFGVTAKREVSRLTPSGTWTFRPDHTPDMLLPMVDGALVMLSDDGKRMQLRRVRPPEARVTDSTVVPHAELIVSTDIGDRIYFIGDSGVAGVRVRDMTRTRTIRLSGKATDAVATPSGDRLFVSVRGKTALVVIDRYAEEVERTIELGASATALRMDPDGQYVLARLAGADSVAIIAVGTSQVTGRVRSTWRSDLPLVGPDGRLALAHGGDVVIVEPDTHAERAHFTGGANDLWALIRWNGFRPRAQGLDEPVQFARDSAAATTTSTDSLIASIATSPNAIATATKPPETPPPAVSVVRGTTPVKHAFTLSFAAMLSEERANTLAATIRIDGKPVRVVPSSRDGVPVFRVVFGPFDSRDEAERVGRRSGLPYWVYEGAP